MGWSLLKKKKTVINKAQLMQVFRVACRRGIPAKIVSGTANFSAGFLDVDDDYLYLENTLSHLDDVRSLRNRAITLFFPFRNTLLKGRCTMIGLATVKNMRALRFSFPESLTSDEKRSVKRMKSIPKESSLTFSTDSLRLFEAKILDVSPGGFGFCIQEDISDHIEEFSKTSDLQVEATLAGELKLSFVGKICHLSRMEKHQLPYRFHVGVMMRGLAREAQERLNQWIFNRSSFETKESDDRETDEKPQRSILVSNQDENASSILVISSREEDMTLWYQVLGRKYEVITCDTNIANIRTALSTTPALVLIYMDPKDSQRASFTRKFCGTIQERFPIVFFTDEPDPQRRTVLAGQVRHAAFIDISQRKILTKFRTIDILMQRIQETL